MRWWLLNRLWYIVLAIFLKSEACMPYVYSIHYSFPESTHVKWKIAPWYYRAYQDYVLWKRSNPALAEYIISGSTQTYLGYFIGMTTASLRRRLAVSKPLMLSHLTSGLPRMISLQRLVHYTKKVEARNTWQYQNGTGIRYSYIIGKTVTSTMSRLSCVFLQIQKKGAEISACEIGMLFSSNDRFGQSNLHRLV
jgi:hypothetical protein